MGSRETYDEALARRLALLRAELTGERAAAEAARARAERAAERAGMAEPVEGVPTAGSDAATDLPGDVSRDGPEPAVATLRAPGRHASRRFPSVTERLPPGLLTPGVVAVVAVVLALGVGLVAWSTLRAEPRELPTVRPAGGELATPVALAGTATAPSTTASGRGGAVPGAVSGEVIVHVAGKVRRPGIVVLSPGARVVDAVKAAGGARGGVDLGGINLARPLVDGEQLLVGVTPTTAAGTPIAGPATADGSGRVNLNTASAAQLEELPGVGPVTASAIVAFREEHGAFTSVDQLLDVSGIGEATLAEIAPHATV